MRRERGARRRRRQRLGPGPDGRPPRRAARPGPRRRTRRAGAGWTIARGPLRDAAHATAPAGSTAMVAGNAAVFADVSDSIAHDLKLIFPIAAALIGLILVADAAQRRRPALPAGRRRARVRRDARRRGARLPDARRSQRRRVHAAARPVPVRRRAGHGLQHPDDRAAARGDARGSVSRARRSPRPSATWRPRSPPPAWSSPARSGR